MKNIYWTVSLQLRQLIKNAFIFPFWFSLASAIIFLTVNKINGKPINKKVFTDKVLPLSLMVFVFSMIMQLTLLSRIGETADSFSNIWGNWGFIRQEYSFDLSCIENIIMFIPLPLTINWFICKFKGRNLSVKRIIIISVLISFCLSIFIEINQAIFSIGFFQISDLFYNTLGGIIGTAIYILITKKARR